MEEKEKVIQELKDNRDTTFWGTHVSIFLILIIVAASLDNGRLFLGSLLYPIVVLVQYLVKLLLDSLD